MAWKDPVKSFVSSKHQRLETFSFENLQNWSRQLFFTSRIVPSVELFRLQNPIFFPLKFFASNERNLLATHIKFIREIILLKSVTYRNYELFHPFAVCLTVWSVAASWEISCSTSVMFVSLHTRSIPTLLICQFVRVKSARKSKTSGRIRKHFNNTCCWEKVKFLHLHEFHFSFYKSLVCKSSRGEN